MKAHRTRKLACIGAAVTLLGLMIAPPAQSGTGSLGPPPQDCGAVGLDYTDPSCTTQTRNGTFSLSDHLVRAGQNVSGSVNRTCQKRDENGELGPCPVDWTGMKQLGKRVHGCGMWAANCTVEIPKSSYSDGSSGWFTVTVGITSDQGTGISKDYLAIAPKDSATIEGKVKNKNGEPVAGVKIRAEGPRDYTATTGADGSYDMIVRPGRYRLTPDARQLPGKTPSFDPAHATVDVDEKESGSANFEVESGVVVELELSSTTVTNDGFQIITGTVMTKEFGAKPNVTVSIRPQEEIHPNDAPTAGPRINICGPSARIWPGGGINDPKGDPVDVVTDGNGRYEFSIAVGTVPGTFTLDVWGRDSKGELITKGLADATDEETITVTSIGTHSLDDFESAYNTVAQTHTNPITTNITENEDVIASSFQQLAPMAGLDMQGYGATVIYGIAGSASKAVLIYQAHQPPTVGTDAKITAQPTDLVLQPNRWRGGQVESLETALREGRLPTLPTVAQWGVGEDVPAWQYEPHYPQVISSEFKGLGWPYPSSTPGVCY